MQDCHVCDALSSRNILPAHTGSTLASPASSGFRDRRQRGAGGHSLVVIMNGAGEGSHTDAAAGQVDQFTQPVFEAERKRKRFVVGTPRKQNNKTLDVLLPAACVRKHTHRSLLKVALSRSGQNSSGK